MVANEDEIRSAGARFDRAGFWIAPASGTLLSLALTRFLFAYNNNLFHLPIVAELYDEPQFTNVKFPPPRTSTREDVGGSDEDELRD
ncbi:MAG: hypothetical protein ACR2KT_14365 [Methylocella sp.]|nr:MAG: hypothetical protein DLM68_02585 [Hyphomicrobiales bacterium]